MMKLGENYVKRFSGLVGGGLDQLEAEELRRGECCVAMMIG